MRISGDPHHGLLEQAGIEDMTALTSVKIYQAALAGDELARDVFRETGTYLGVALGSLINILNPEMIIIGGGASKAWDFFYPAMMDEMRKRVLTRMAQQVRVVPARLGDEAGLIGACGLIAQALGFLK